MNTEEKVRMANQLYECKRTIKTLYGDKWKTVLEYYKKVIGLKMKADAIDEVTAAIRLANDNKGEHGHGAILLMAAAVDMVEPE